MAKLKVFRTTIGFDDAFVAAPSRAAALRAWGARTDLFAAGAADVVTDPKLTAAPLGDPGTIFRTSRGSTADHLNALAKKRRAPAVPSTKRASPRLAKRSRPRPSRAGLDAAEAALELAVQEKTSALAAIADELARLEARRAEADRRHEARIEKLGRTSETARRRYQAALERWRNDAE